MVASYRRSAYQLPLNVLAIGDPAAPVADVSVWHGASTGPLIARVGPGTGGDADVHANRSAPAAADHRRGVLAFESRPVKGLQLELAHITKREQPLLGLADTGVPSSAYTAFQVPDPELPAGESPGRAAGDGVQPAAGQLRTRSVPVDESERRSRDVLGHRREHPGVNRPVHGARRRDLWTRTFAPAAAVGFLPTENDQDVLGNLFVDPNAATAARGQVFPDRSHTVKVAGVYRFPWRVRVGAIARYQDGQPFARLVVVPDLTQGPTAVRAYVNGGTAFTYTGTLDIRVQKIFTAGRSEVAAIVDVYNLPNLGNEVTEYVVSGAMFRDPTALQPSRTALVGVRVTF